MQLVTGHTGTEHVTSDQAGAMHAGIVGDGTYVLNTGSKLAATMLNANTVSIADGDLMLQGRHCAIMHGSTEELTVQNGTQAQKRNDLVVARYEKLDTEPRTESVTLRVIKGTPSDGEAEDPEYEDGDIRAGDLVVEAPLYRIRLDGITVSDPEPMVDVLVPMADLWDSVSQLPDVQTGTKYSIDVVSGTYTDVPVTFERPFASTPMCFCCLRTASQYSSYGSISPVPINATATGFTIRLYNDSDKGAVPSINWVAIL